MNRSQRRQQRVPGGDGPTFMPAPPPGTARDLRIVYGAGCTYWGDIHSIQLVNVGGHSMPACPHCGGMLFEQETEAAWMAAVQAHAAQSNDPGYVEFMRWCKGRACLSQHVDQDGLTAFTRLRAQYDAEVAQL